MLSEAKSVANVAIQYKTLDDNLVKDLANKDVEGLIALSRQSLDRIKLEGEYPNIRKLDIAFNEFKVH
jgi:hypothetical protein